MINWNEVKVGETEIASPRGLQGVVGGLYKDWVWLHFRDKGLDSYHKNSLLDWTIYDPWEEITDLVQLVPYCESDYLFCMEFEWRTIYHHNPNFKRDGRRVWKRKEG